MADGGVSLGKGAWDCDTNSPIPPEKEAEVFEEIPTLEHAFEGIPTVPPHKDVEHLAFFCGACRYRVTARPDWTVEAVKRALFAGGIGRASPGIRGWEDLELLYAMERMADNKVLADYGVPPGCKAMIAIERSKLESGRPDADSPYWN